ncbi:restriction endonuclease [Yinghuangia sp. YIM S10712]|uniref:restriction endonuclease n=1 Tax=Yinghuangia sp. YIM S10712 TaxID=3436930 RepID=UPI003F53B75F
MARRKSITSQLLGAYQQRQKVREQEQRRIAAEEARQAAEIERHAKAELQRAKAKQQKQAAAERKRLREETEQRREQKRIDAAEQRARQELARIRQEAQRREATREREKQRAAAESAKEAQRLAAERMVSLAEESTRQAASRVEGFETLLSRRCLDLTEHRLAVGRNFDLGGPEELTRSVCHVLAHPIHLAGEPEQCRATYAPEQRQLVVDFELPRQSVVPTASAYRYVKSRGEIVPQPRKEAEVKAIYGRLVARTALRVIDQAFRTTPPQLVDTVVFNGHVSAKDPATGKPIRPCLISVEALRGRFEELELDETELDPILCLRGLNAIVSPHPFDLEAVRPVIQFDLSRYKFVEEVDVVAGMDARHDLLTLTPGEFEHLIRRLFEAAGMKAWVTQQSKDEGVDAVAVVDDPLMSFTCVIQAKRYSKVVGLEAAHALAGVMEDKNAGKAILVTTSWFGKSSRDFVQRHGRIELIDGRGLKAMLKEHLGLDVLIGLPKIPPGWNRHDIT